MWAWTVGYEQCCGVAWALLRTPSSPPSDSQSASHRYPSLRVAKQMHGGSGARSSFGSENQGPQFHCQERCRRDQAKSAGARPCGLKAFNLTVISIPGAPSWVSDLRDRVLPMPFPLHSLVHLSSQLLSYIDCEGLKLTRTQSLSSQDQCLMEEIDV